MSNAKRIRNLGESISRDVEAEILVRQKQLPGEVGWKSIVRDRKILSAERTTEALEDTRRSQFENALYGSDAVRKSSGNQKANAMVGSASGSEFAGLRIAFEGDATEYEWGDWHNRINSNPYQLYFDRVQQLVQIETLGVEPFFPNSTRQWGNVILNIVSFEFDNRFGGSVHVTLAPEEDFGVELGDRGNNLYLDLHRWLLHIYVRLSSNIFNQPNTTRNRLPPLCYVEIEAFDTEVYTSNASQLLPQPSATENDVNALIRAAADEATGRLFELATFVYGYIHETKLGGFDATGSRVTKIFVSDGLCAFETEDKTPYVAIKMKSHYLGTNSLEGLFDSDPELTAEPWILLKRQRLGLVVMSVERKKYIGGASSTPMMVMGYLSLAEIALVNYVLAFTGWTEDDPISDDFGGSFGFEFDVQFDPEDLQNRVDSGDLGEIGEKLYALQNDNFYQWLTYGVEIEFELVML